MGDVRVVGSGQINVGEVHNYFLDKLHRGQVANIPYKTIKSQRNDPKWGPPWYSETARALWAPEGSQAHGFESWPRSEVRKGIHSG
ncbi:hypothetical protein E2C01_092190 [Portunus trituberculatus]|uniref:Uncharacterized protein n=1 Tax=Portunus trituberculatus TaxID=210409 RepID=A0A5B7JPX9_PORTR|nr:hypothetical protein [Portunus trituberculatus]